MYWQGAVKYDRDSILDPGAIVLSPALETVTLSATWALYGVIRWTLVGLICQ